MIIGVSGFALSGKDATGAYLAERYGFERVRFAAKLKSICADIYGFSHEQIDGKAKDEPDPRYPLSGQCPKCGEQCDQDTHGAGWFCGPCGRLWPVCLTPRLAMQQLGTEGARRLYADVWVEATLRDLDPGRRWAVCDVRYPNEVEGIRRRGGKVIRRLRGAPESDHPSETSLADRSDLYDAAIGDCATLDELHAEIDRLMSEWRIR